MTTKLTFEVDELDYEAILAALAKHRECQVVDGEHMLPDGEGDLHGRILAEVCRGWCEFIDMAGVEA